MGTLALPLSYEAPEVTWQGEVATEQPGLWWVVWVVTFGAALSWASYCLYVGGSPSIDFSWWRWKVSCYR